MSVVEDFAVDEARAPGALVRSAPGLRIGIAGVGLVTVLGNSAEETWSQLLRGRSISDHSKVKKEWGTSRVAGLAIDAAREAIGEAAWGAEEIESAGLVVGTSKGKVIDWMASAEAVPTGVGAVAHELSGELGMRYAPKLTVSA